MAITQLLWGQLRQGLNALSLTRSVGLAVGMVALYLGLAEISTHFFAGLLPVEATASTAFQTGLGLALLSFFLLSITFQEAMAWPLPARLRQAFYVHALNGFYLNTLANRFARRAGLVPPGR